MVGPGKGLYRHHKQAQRCQTPARMDKMIGRRFERRPRPDPVLPDLSVKYTGTTRHDYKPNSRSIGAKLLSIFSFGLLGRRDVDR